jgi:hypothetical protein
MTVSEGAKLAEQATRAAARVSTWPKWQQALATTVAESSGRDTEPRVSPVVVRAVEQVLQGDDDEN